MTQGSGGPHANACPDCRGNAVRQTALRAAAFCSWEATGRWCKVRQYGHRYEVILAECKCGICGRTWWSNHTNARGAMSGSRATGPKIEITESDLRRIRREQRKAKAR